MERYKGRLVAKGYSQRYGIDYDETFAPVVKFSSIRAILVAALKKNMIIHQMDVQTAFHHGKLNEDIYMLQPEGFVEPRLEHLVCKLNKSLYGLKQSPRCWNSVLHEYLILLGFKRSDADPCVYVDNSDSLMYIAVYVDDLIIAASCDDKLSKVKASLSSRFKMKDMGKLHFCLGVSIDYDAEKKCILMHQKQYILQMLERYGLMEAKTCATPFDTSVNLQKSEKEVDTKNQANYQSQVGSLLYAAMAIRPDIAYAVGVVSKFNAYPSAAHFKTVKRIFQYLKLTSNFAIKYVNLTQPRLIAFSDADWAGDRDDRHSTSGNVFIFGGGAVSWLSKKQAVVALSTSEAEYVALSSATQEAIWLKRLLIDLNVIHDCPIVIQEDNQGATAMSKNPVFHGRTKQIDIQYHFIREAVVNGTIELEYCNSENMVADIFTKALSKPRFEKLRACLGLEPLFSPHTN